MNFINQINVMILLCLNYKTQMISQLVLVYLLHASATCWSKIWQFQSAQSSQFIHSLVFSPDNSLLFSVGSSQTLKIWNTQNYTLIEEIDIKANVNKIIIHPSTSDLYLCTSTGKILAFDSQYQLIYSSQYPSGEPFDMVWKDENGSSLLIVGQNEGVAKVFIYGINLEYQGEIEISDFSQGARIEQIAVNPNFSNFLISTSSPNNITHLIRFNQQGQDIQTYQTNQNYDEDVIKLLQFEKTNTNALFVVEKGTNQIQVRDLGIVTYDPESIFLETGDQITALNGDFSSHILVGFTNKLTNQSAVSIFQYWNNQTQQNLVHPGRIMSIAVSPDEEIIAVGLEHEGIFLWKNIQQNNQQIEKYAYTLGFTLGIILIVSLTILVCTITRHKSSETILLPGMVHGYQSSIDLVKY